MIRKLLYTILGFTVGSVAARLIARHSHRVEYDKPGDWFESYANDWDSAHGEIADPDDVRSGFVRGQVSRLWIWVTETPEWDHGWFTARGGEFPENWVPYQYLVDHGVADDDGMWLPGL